MRTAIPLRPERPCPPGFADTWLFAFLFMNTADGDRSAELSNANKSYADRRVTGNPPCSSPRRRATSTQILETTSNHKPYAIQQRNGLCLLSIISDVLTTSSLQRRKRFSYWKKECATRPIRVVAKNHHDGPGGISEATFSWQLIVAPIKVQRRSGYHRQHW